MTSNNARPEPHTLPEPVEGRFEPEAERVTRLLRDQIVDGVRSPGSKLVERELATEMGVSRVPIRDALKQLVTEGLATPRPRSWTIVREFTAADITDLIEVRSALEVLTFRLAAERRTEAGLDQLRTDLDTEMKAAKAGDAIGARRAGADFHETSTVLAGNALLMEVSRSTQSRMRWLLSQHEDLVAMAQEHADLYAAIAAQDVDQAVALSVQHVINSREAALHRLS